MKKMLLAILLGLVSLTVIGCGSEQTEARIQLDFWHMSPVGSESFSDTRQMITTFNESQETYFVKGTGFSFWDYWDKINVAVSSRTAPDIGLSTIDDVVARAEAGVLYNISDFMAADPNQIDLEDYYDSQLEFASYNDELYAMPFTATTRVLYYNLDMFEAAGLTEDDVPHTWSELYTVAKQLDIVEDGTIEQLGFEPTYGNATYHGYLWQSGLDFFDEDLNPTLDTQGHIDVLEWIGNFNSEFTRAQLTSFGDANTMLGINAFAGERVAMMIETDGLYQIINEAEADFNYGITYIPLPDEDGIRVNWGSGFSIELYDNGTGDEEAKQGAWEFLKYIMSYDVQIELADSNGWIMGNRSAMATVAEGNPIVTRLIEEVQYARDKIYVPYAPSWHGNDWQTYYSQFLNDELSAEECLAAAKENYLEKQENYNDTRG